MSDKEFNESYRYIGKDVNFTFLQCENVLKKHKDTFSHKIKNRSGIEYTFKIVYTQPDREVWGAIKRINKKSPMYYLHKTSGKTMIIIVFEP